MMTVDYACSIGPTIILIHFMQINEFVKLGGDQLVPYYAAILGAILPCISDKEEKIRAVSSFSNFHNISVTVVYVV